MQWVRVIDGALQEWEAKNRQRTGRPKGGTKVPSVTGDITRDDESAQGIRRRIQKRATAGDDHAQSIVVKLATGELSPNAAAIAAGMRERYIRISPVTSKAAKGLFIKQDRELRNSFSVHYEHTLVDSDTLLLNTSIQQLCLYRINPLSV